ncbi:FUN14 family-domain-containing protein [Amanita rubescens]|nr:FUN14 family-domain-containing protein [Amanita rubescens]
MTTLAGLLTRTTNATFIRTARLHARSSLLSTYPAFARHSAKAVPKLVVVGGLSLGFVAFSNLKPTIHCDESQPQEVRTTHEIYAPPQSSVSLPQLTFGTVTGICAGVFIKKGAKAVAWFLGGIFILLQYLSSASLVRVDWARMATKFEDLVYVRDACGKGGPPTPASIWRWLINFLTADFQPRASFIAGLALGLRLG